MRADAVRRRESILSAARAVFAERGADVALEAVAEAAGVGIATVYRNFASRADLTRAVVHSIMGDVRDASEAATRAVEEDGLAGWEAFVRRLVSLRLGALSEALADHVAGDGAGEVRQAQADLLASVDHVLAIARGRGLVRADLSAVELVVAAGLAARLPPAAVQAVAPDLPERLTVLLLAGLRPVDP